MNIPDEQYPNLVEFKYDRGKEHRFSDGGKIGRLWATIAGPYTLGDVHISAPDPEYALFSELILEVWAGGERSVLASTWDGEHGVAELRALLYDERFLLPAIWKAAEKFNSTHFS